ncbi:MAG: hypothetical protein QXQ57_03120 [Sulfolobales archaeon]
MTGQRLPMPIFYNRKPHPLGRGGGQSLVEDPESIWELGKGYMHMKRASEPSVIQIIVESVRS